MRMTDIIAAKRDGKELTREQIDYFVTGYTAGDIPDYQASALLMAIYIRGMSPEETAWMTLCMAHSGDMADLSSIPGIKVDKHSTGGVGDKTTLIVCPIAAACGVPIAKMSGRGLGHTGGTVDKLQSIPGYRTELDRAEFLSVIRKTGMSLIGQSGNIAPADKKIYALRDVTATTESLPLIASSIMSKKIAAGSNAILLDVKVGSGAFMKTLDDAVMLAKRMVEIGEHTGRKTAALLTDMAIPLGHAIGNALEVAEAVETLKGRGPKDLTKVCLALAQNMLFLAEKGSMEDCMTLAAEALDSGAAFAKLKETVFAQGGDLQVLEKPELLPQAKVRVPLRAKKDAWVKAIDAYGAGTASVMLGAGREKKEDPIDYGAGILLLAKPGDRVKEGQPIAILCTEDEGRIAPTAKILEGSYSFSDTPPSESPFILGRVTEKGAELY